MTDIKGNQSSMQAVVLCLEQDILDKFSHLPPGLTIIPHYTIIYWTRITVFFLKRIQQFHLILKFFLYQLIYLIRQTRFSYSVSKIITRQVILHYFLVLYICSITFSGMLDYPRSHKHLEVQWLSTVHYLFLAYDVKLLLTSVNVTFKTIIFLKTVE